MQAKILTGEQILRIHEASLTILEQVGVGVPHAEMLDRFADSGALVDHQAQRVRIPAHLVLRSLQQAGKTFTIYGRDLEKKASFGRGTKR